ncbi:LAFA_0G21814g1_1 [Lachancea sp. 'fantastica']|nr:LAFA_0G21814g1_1 [Lachancea sp. 'fantastica']
MSNRTSELNPSEFPKVFDDACDAIEQKMGQNTSASLLKKEVLEIFELLRSVSDSISAYDLERYNSRLTRLLKRITTDASSSTTRKFQFKSRPQPKDQVKDDNKAQNMQHMSNAAVVSPKCVGKALEFETGAEYENLENCSLTFENEKLSDCNSSAIHIKSCHNSVINFKGLPFLHGSIYIEDAGSCVIVFRLPELSHIQIRLHGLESCDIYVAREDSQLQSVVLENCKDLRFHSNLRDITKIQDFSSVGKTSAPEQPNYRYKDFDLCNFETPALMRCIQSKLSSQLTQI